MTVIKIIGLVTGAQSAFDGQFVTEYDPGRDGREPFTNRRMSCHLRTTPDRAKALDLPAAEAFVLWRRVDRRSPRRPDGKPNRPLTAFTVELLK